MKFKKTSAALLVATMAVTGAGYAWADENVVDVSEFLQQTPTEENSDAIPETNDKSIVTEEEITVDEDNTVTEETTEETDSTETTETTEETDSTDTTETTKNDTESTEIVFPAIPEGYTAGNLVALQKAFNNAGNDTAKAAIARNAERAIAKFEAKQEAQKQEEATVAEKEVIVEETTEVEKQTVTEQPTTVAPTVKTDKASVKEARKTLQAEHKSERKALKQEQKAEKQALKEKK